MTHKNIIWMSLLVYGTLLYAEPSESQLAGRLETQAEVAVGHTNFNGPPLSRFSILVSEIAQGNARSASLDEDKNTAGTLEFTGDRSAALAVSKFLTDSPSSTLTPLENILGSPAISELAGVAADSVRLLSLALDKGAGNASFMTLSAKGAIQSWNQLVNALMDRMEQLYKEPVPDVKEWESLRNFLMDPKTHEFRGVLAGFAEKKSP